MIHFPENTNVEDAFHILRRNFENSGIKSSSLDARLLLSEILGISHVQFISSPDRHIQKKDHKVLAHAAGERMSRKPMSHILGVKEFYSRDFIVSSDTLTPRPDSEVLIDTALWHIKRLLRQKSELSILDLGTGSGCLLLTLLAECDQAVGEGVDMSSAALNIARQNAASLGLADRCVFKKGNWFEPAMGKFDLIISNPPYIASSEIEGLQEEVRLYEPHLALDGGADGMEPYRIIIPGAKDYLHAGGCVIVEIGADQYRQVKSIFIEHKQEQGMSHLGLEKDIEGRDRCVHATY